MADEGRIEYLAEQMAADTFQWAEQYANLETKNERLREAIASAMRSLATYAKDGYAYEVLDAALQERKDG